MPPVVSSQRRPFQWWWCCSTSAAFLAVLLSVLFAQWPSSFVRVVPLLLAYALMPPDRVAVGGLGGSRVRETKKALLGRSRPATSATSRSPASTAAGSSALVPNVVKGTVSKITEKFQAQPPPPPQRTTRIPKPLQRTPDRGSAPAVVKLQPPPLPPMPPPVVKYEIKRRQEKLLSELHRRRDGQPADRTNASFSHRLPVGGGGGGAAADSAVSSDCGSSSDSEKSICCGSGGGGSIDKPDDKPGSPHSSGYESVEETISVARTAVPYSWVFGAPEPSLHDSGFGETLQQTLSTSSSASSDGCCEGDDDDDDDDEKDVPEAPEDRLERLVTFASATSCPALTRAKLLDQDDDEDVPEAIIRRHFGGGNDGSKTIASMTGGYLSPIPECSSTEPNSVETVEDYTDGEKVGGLRPF